MRGTGEASQTTVQHTNEADALLEQGDIIEEILLAANSSADGALTKTIAEVRELEDTLGHHLATEGGQTDPLFVRACHFYMRDNTKCSAMHALHQAKVEQRLLGEGPSKSSTEIRAAEIYVNSKKDDGTRKGGQVGVRGDGGSYTLTPESCLREARAEEAFRSRGLEEIDAICGPLKHTRTLRYWGYIKRGMEHSQAFELATSWPRRGDKKRWMKMAVLNTREFPDARTAVEWVMSNKRQVVFHTTVPVLGRVVVLWKRCIISKSQFEESKRRMQSEPSTFFTKTMDCSALLQEHRLSYNALSSSAALKKRFVKKGGKLTADLGSGSASKPPSALSPPLDAVEINLASFTQAMCKKLKFVARAILLNCYDVGQYISLHLDHSHKAGHDNSLVINILQDSNGAPVFRVTELRNGDGPPVTHDFELEQSHMYCFNWLSNRILAHEVSAIAIWTCCPSYSSVSTVV
jgi:hypothetical protein